MAEKTNKSKRPKKNPPRPPRQDLYGDPQSPWQQMIYYRLKGMDMSIRTLAEAIEINRGTLWIWLHTKNGVPHPKSFKAHHMKRIAEALELDENTLRQAWDASRLQFSPSQAPLRESTLESLEGILEFFQSKKTTYIRRSQVVSMLSMLTTSAKSAQVPAPPA